MDAERDHVVKYPDSPLGRRKTSGDVQGREWVTSPSTRLLSFLDLYLKCGNGETRRAGAI